MRYVIVVDYYVENPNNPDDFNYTEPHFLGVDENRIFVMETEVTERTKIFNSAREVGEYIDNCNMLNGTSMRCSFRTFSVRELDSNNCLL